MNMYSFLIVILLYSLLFVRSCYLSLANHYAASLTLSVWLFLSYVIHDAWLAFVLLLIATGVGIYAITYWLAVKKGMVRSISEYALDSYKGENRKLELALFTLYYLVLSPLVERLDCESVYVLLIPFAYFGIERTLFCMFMRNHNNS